MNFKDQSFQLLSTDQNHKLYLTLQAKQFLTSITKPISIISIAGMYRTGKSCLLNRLLKTKQAGFKTSPTTHSVTKGLSIWGRPITAFEQAEQQFFYLVIDSEGIGSCQQEAKYDMNLLMLIFMVSSTVIYNSMGAIDEQALQQLREIVSLRDILLKQSVNQKTKFVWVLRDFSLQLVNKNQVQITSNQYLQQCLQKNQGNSLQINRKNQIRRAIRQGLGEKTCFTLVRPTINQEDLVDLTCCKLRTEFVNQIQMIREKVFSGSNQDVKKIEGHPLNGRLLVGLMEKCIQVLNKNGAPNVLQIWQSVRTLAYEQAFMKICQQLKQQVCNLFLPMSIQELRLKLNEIKCKYYSKMQQNFIQISSFKHYHKQFQTFLQKSQKNIKNSNIALIKQKRMKDLRQFVKQNICFSNIQPTNISLIKTLIDRMQLKAQGEIEGYQYVLSVLFDILRLCEQKTLSMHKQLIQSKRNAEVNNSEQKNHYLVALNMKKEYHEALKAINNLKINQQENLKQIALTKHQLEVKNNELQYMRQQSQIRQNSLLRQIQEINCKNKQSNHQMSNIIKRLRQQNIQLISELSFIKQHKVNSGLQERKQMIFQQKMILLQQKFAEQRKQMAATLQKSHKNAQNLRLKYEQQRLCRQQQQQKFHKQREHFASNQIEFTQQIKQLKNMHTEVKKTYDATFYAIKDNHRILKSIQNKSICSPQKKKYCKGQSEDRYLEDSKEIPQLYLQKSKSQYQKRLNHLVQEIQLLKKINEQLATKNNEIQLQFKECVEQNKYLKKQLAMIRQRFANNISEMQNAKFRERTLYEQSIVRLLANLDKKQRDQYKNVKK